MSQQQTKKLGVLGFPISHSKSPKLHNFWLKKYNIDAVYEPYPVEPENLEKFLREMPEKGFLGVNLTIPHKEAALKFVDEINRTANIIGAVNTIIVKDGKLVAYNTDAIGFVKNLEQGQLKQGFELLEEGKVLVIGAGGAARAVCAGLWSSGKFEIILANRTKAKAQAMKVSFEENSSDNINITVIDWAELESVMSEVSLLVNTTSLGMTGQPELNISLENLPKDALVTDIVYNPLITPLLAQAAKRGNPNIDGLGMLLYQAQAAFHLWFGIYPDVDQELREFILQQNSPATA